MVASIRHSANATAVIAESVAAIRTTAFGQLLFGKKALDPFMEHRFSLWLIHWQLCARPEKTT
jgi:hypothetical protein